MRINNMVQGFFLGFVTGLLVTVFDGLYMAMPNFFIPRWYPVVLTVFNIVLWTVTGGLSGLIVWSIMRGKKFFKNELFCWTLFFLFPFTVIYGILGKLNLEDPKHFPIIFSYTFDRHAAFVWAGLLVSFLLLYFRKNKQNSKFSFLIFAPEIITIIILFQFCSNPECLKILTFVKKVQPEGGTLLKAILYLLGTLIILGFYALFFIKIRPIFIKHPLVQKPLLLVIALIISVPIYMGCLNESFSKSYDLNATPAPVLTVPKNLSDQKPPNVILIVFDTLRAASIKALQGSGFINNIESFAKDSEIFENCVASSHFTLPSHASLFTGVYPSEHGCEFVVDNYLSDQFITLAEQFKAHGYRTAAVASNNIYLNNTFNMLQGFEITSSFPNIGIRQQLPFRPALLAFSYLTNIYNKSIVTHRTAADINTTALEAINRIAKEPFFLFLNYMDVHKPYRASSPYDGYFLNQNHPQLYRLKQYYLQCRNKNTKEAWDKYLLSQYYGTIAYLDTEFGSLMNCLKKLGLYDSSLIIVTSDHGDLFGEHGLYGHLSPMMFEEIAKIPLFIKFPQTAKTGPVTDIINLTDLYPTILSICGFPVPKDISGIAFGDRIGSGFAGVTDHMICYEQTLKYMEYGTKYADENDPAKVGQNFLFDLRDDPDEIVNLAEKMPQKNSSIKQRIDQWKTTHKKKFSQEHKVLPDDVKEGLKALGYIQ